MLGLTVHRWGRVWFHLSQYRPHRSLQARCNPHLPPPETYPAPPPGQPASSSGYAGPPRVKAPAPELMPAGLANLGFTRKPPSFTDEQWQAIQERLLARRPASADRLANILLDAYYTSLGTPAPQHYTPASWAGAALSGMLPGPPPPPGRDDQATLEH